MKMFILRLIFVLLRKKSTPAGRKTQNWNSYFRGQVGI